MQVHFDILDSHCSRLQNHFAAGTLQTIGRPIKPEYYTTDYEDGIVDENQAQLAVLIDKALAETTGRFKRATALTTPLKSIAKQRLKCPWPDLHKPPLMWTGEKLMSIASTDGHMHGSFLEVLGREIQVKIPSLSPVQLVEAMEPFLK